MSRIRRLVTAVVAVEVCLVALAGPSFAGGPWNNTKHSPSKKTTTPPSTIGSEVRYQRSYHGPGARMAPAAGADWSPPACWYEPEFTPEQFEGYINSHYVSDDNAFAQMADKYGADGFHKGDKGAWWKLMVPDLSRARRCAGIDDCARR